MGIARPLWHFLIFSSTWTAHAQPDSVAVVMPVLEVRAPRLDPRALLDRDTGFAALLNAESWADGLTVSSAVLGQSLGVHVRSRGPLGASSTLSVRGSSTVQVPVYLDGVLLNDPLRGGVDLGSIDVSALERIEVHRSGAPLSLGASSLGGAVHLFSKRQLLPPRLLLGGGSYGERFAEAAAGWELGRTKLTTQGRIAQGEGDWRTLDDKGTQYNRADDEWVKRVNNDAHTRSLLLRAARPWRDGELSLSEQWRDREVGDPGVLHHADSRLRFGERDQLLRLQFSRPVGLLRESSLYLHNSRPFLDDPGAEYGLPSERRDQLDELGFAVRAAPRAGRDAAHVQWSSQRLQSEDRLQLAAEGEAQWRHSLQSSAEVQFERASWRLSPGLLVAAHYERFHSVPSTSLLPSGELQEELRFSHLAQLGLRRTLQPGLQLKANVAQSQRLPTLIELYGLRAGVLGNSQLRPESAWLADVGLIYQGDSGRRLEVAYFQNSYDDLIAFEPINPSAVKARNVAAARSHGLEIGVDYGAIGVLRCSSQLDLLATEDRSDDPLRRGEPLVGRPSFEFLQRLAVAVTSHASVDYELTALGRSYYESGGRSPVPTRVLHGLAAHLRRGRVGLHLQCDNITDAEVIDIWRYPLAGRTIRLSLELQGGTP